MVPVVVGFGFCHEGQQPMIVKRSFGIVVKPYAKTFEKPC
jgi:tryptophan synthase alpha subunit